MTITREQAAQVLQDIVDDKIRVKSSGWVYCNHVVLASLDRQIYCCFFINCDRLRYLDSIYIGEDYADFDQLWDDDSGTDVLDLLPNETCDRLKEIMKNYDLPGAWEEYCQKVHSSPSFSSPP